MGGKSTVMRQTALIVILGQIGAPVPATSAEWGAVSSVYTRIGAHDAIARGQSTFMVEMSELAHILHHADERSLIILDEIGRGTSTYDGISVAWSTLEWICKKIRARTLFATHYHELTQLDSSLPHLANAHMAVENTKTAQNPGGKLRFLYLLREGPTNDSFGIHVARIAGLPKQVIDRAWKVLQELEKHSLQSGKSDHSRQLSLLALMETPEPSDLHDEEIAPQPLEPHPVLAELEQTNVNEMTPLQALSLVAKLQEMAKTPINQLPL
jgi:DNA mismatch repair protein MutS